MTREQIKDAAMQLDPTDREQLAEELLYSISESEWDALDNAWLEEIQKRSDRLDQGIDFGIPLEDALKLIERKPSR